MNGRLHLICLLGECLLGRVNDLWWHARAPTRDGIGRVVITAVVAACDATLAGALGKRRLGRVRLCGRGEGGAGCFWKGLVTSVLASHGGGMGGGRKGREERGGRVIGQRGGRKELREGQSLQTNVEMKKRRKNGMDVIVGQEKKKK